MKKILFVIYSIHGGGAERVMQDILKYIDRKRFIPVLCIFKATGKENDVVPPDVKVFNISTQFRPASFFLTIKLIVLLFKVKPHRIVSFMWGANLITIAARFFYPVKTYCVEHIETDKDLKNTKYFNIFKFLIKLLYRMPVKIVAVSKAVKEGLINNFYIPEKKIDIIYNGLDIKKIKQLSESFNCDSTNYIITCGRLEKQKNHDFLLDVMALVQNKINIPLYIFGEGSERNFLQNKINSKHINAVLKGFTENPYPWIKNARLFVLSSNYEGFGIVLTEAMACQVPVISTNCSAVNEIIDDGKNGFLIPLNDKNAMADIIIKLLNDEKLCLNLKDNAFKKVINSFTIEKMIESYENILC